MSDDFKTQLGRAVLMVLKPLLRVLIRHEITVPDFSELVRQAYVDVAYEHFGIEGKKLTYARVAVLTGLNRKEVVRLSNLRGDPGRLTRPSPNRAQRVVNGWLADDTFLTARGKPRVLPLQGEAPSFAALVARYSGDITLGAVLDELLRVGVVRRDERDHIHLERIGYVPAADELEKVRVMAVCAADLLGTAVHNIEKGDVDPKFQRQLVYPEVPAHIADEFRVSSAALSADYLQQLNRLIADLRDRAANDDETAGATAATDPIDSDRLLDRSRRSRRVGFGLYYFDKDIHTDDDSNPV